ncbi:MAG: hypothetical protein RLZZ436_2721 [Planctomycetota bacterium]
MARSPRSEYVSSSENAAFLVICHQARSALAPLSGQCNATEDLHRVEFIEDLIRTFAQFFCISVHAHAVLHREIRLILEARPECVKELDDAEVARRWLKICPTLRPAKLRCCEPTEKEIAKLCADSSRISQIRSHLSDISWFQRLLQQRIALFCNHEDGITGRFWSDRYRSIVLLDDVFHSLGMANVDLGAVCVSVDGTISAGGITSALLRQCEQTAGETCSSCRVGHAEDPQENNAPTRTDKSSAAEDRLESDPEPVIRCVCSRHLSPIRLCGLSEVAQATAQSRQFRCSDDPAVSMRSADYLELLEWFRRAFHEGTSLDIPDRISVLLGDMRLSRAAVIMFVGSFDQLFSHVAGSPAKMDAYITKSGRRRAWVRPFTRTLFSTCASLVAG